jgi:hypothetical protein
MANLTALSNTPTPAGERMLEQIMLTSHFLRRLEFRRDATDYSSYPVTANSLRPAYRAIGADYTPQNQQPELVSAQLKMFGEDLRIDSTFVDDALAGRRSLDIYMLGREAQVAKGFGEDGEKEFVAGSGSGNSLTGFATRLSGSNVSPWSESFVINASSTALSIAAAAGQDQFIELLDQALMEVPGANMLVMNRALGARMQSIARRLHALTWDKDEFGQPAPFYNGIPIITIADGAITNAEPSGDVTPVNNTTSIYAIRTAEFNGLAGVTNEGFKFRDWTDPQPTQSMIARAELRMGLVIEAPDCIRRIRRIRLVA